MMQGTSGGGLRRSTDNHPTKSQQQQAAQRIISPKNNQQLNNYDGTAAPKMKSISSGRKQQVPQSSSQPMVSPQLHSTQSMSSLSKPFNGNGGRVLISPTNFTSVRTTGGQQSNNNPPTVGNLVGSHQSSSSYQSQQQQQQQHTGPSGSRRQHGSHGKLPSHPVTGSVDLQNLPPHVDNQLHAQMRSDPSQGSQSYLKQLRKSQISALRQLKKPAGEQIIQPINKKSQPPAQGSQIAGSTSGQQYHPKLSLSDRHLANQPRQQSSDTLLQSQQQITTTQQQPTQLESEYGSIGRQGEQKIRFYQSQNNPHHPMSRQAAVGSGVVGTSNKGSDENSDDFQAVAEEDMGSFILHRNAYLDGDIQTAESQLFKQQPKLGKDPRPNPNTHSSKQSQVVATNATGGSSGLAQHRNYSSQKQLVTGSVASQLSHHSGGRLSSQNIHTPMHVEEITSNPSTNMHASEVKQRRKQSINGGQQTAAHQNNAASGSGSGQKSGRKSQHHNYAPGQKPQINSLAGPNGDYTPQVRAMTQMAAPVSSQSAQQPLYANGQQPIQGNGNGVQLLSQSEQKRRAKGLQRVETLTSMGVTKPQYPMFPLEDNKKANIQFEMNLLARQNKQAAVSYSLRQQQSDSQPGTTLLNKATLCDSANSKQNSSQSAFLRKSLWLLTSMKNKALKECVNAQQANCQACLYLRRQGVGCLAPTTMQSPTMHHAQTFIYNQNDSQNNFGGQAIGSLGGTITLGGGSTNMAPEKQLSSHQQQHQNAVFLNQNNVKVLPSSTSKKDGTTGVYQRPQLANLNRQTTKQARLSKQQHSSLTGIIDKTQGGTSSQGVNWLGSMGTQILLVETYEHDFWKALTQKALNTKYLTSQEYYNSKIAADIMYNEQRHIVSVFKEYLIFDDFSEYLKRFYTYKEAQDRLPRVFEFYEHYSKVFPNYVSVPESKYMFKNIERKQKLIDQRHQIYLKQQQAKEGKDKDDKLGAYKHSANMLFGSQFLKEVYADDDKSMSRASIQLGDRKTGVNAQGSKDGALNNQMFESPAFNLQNRLLEHHTDFISPQAKQAQNAKRIAKGASIDASVVRHQGELENVISMLSRFEQSRRGEESMSITISRSYIDGATGLGANQPKQTPQGVAHMQTEASRKNLHRAGFTDIKHMDNQNHVVASNNNLESGGAVKKQRTTGDPFVDGWHFNEPKHDLSMSSWALTSFIKNCDDQPSGTVGMGSIIDTAPFHTDEMSIDDYVAFTGKLKREEEKQQRIVLDEPSNQAPDSKQANSLKRKRLSIQTNEQGAPHVHGATHAKGTVSGKVQQHNGANEVLHQQVIATPSGAATVTSKHARKTIENRRNSAISPKNGQENITGKTIQTVSLVQKSSLESNNKTGSQQSIVKTSRGDREKMIKQTPQRDEKNNTKKKATVSGKTGVQQQLPQPQLQQSHGTNNNLANSRCRSKLSIGSSQTQTQQTMSKKAVQTQNNKKQIEKMIKDSSLKLQLDKNNRQIITTTKRSGATTSTHNQAKNQAGIGASLANLADGNFAIGVGQYNTSQQSMNVKSAKSNSNHGMGGGQGTNSSRNAKVNQTKSNSQLGNATGGHMDTSSAYKTSGHIPSSGVMQGSTKVFKAQGYEDAKGINERFIDLNKASEGAPKISKPSYGSQVLKSGEFSSTKGQSQGHRIGDQSAKTQGNGNQNLLNGVSTQAPHNSVRTGQHGMGFRKSIDGQPLLVGNQQISPINTSNGSKLNGQVKTVQRTYHNRPTMSKPELIHQDSGSIVNTGMTSMQKSNKSPSNKALQSQSNLPQIFKKEQKQEAKTIRSSQYELQKKTIFKHESAVSSTNYASVPSSQQAPPMYSTKKKQSPESTQHQIQFNQQHTSSKSHEPKERQSKLESTSKLLKDPIGMNQPQTTANSVIGHNSQHCIMLVSQNGSQQMMNQASSSGPQSTQNVRMSKNDHHGKLEGNMLIQNNILQTKSSLMQQQLTSGAKGNTNPYSKTGRILNSLNTQKQSVQSLGHMSGTSASGSHHVKGGRNQKLNVKTTGNNNHMLKGTTAQSVSSSSSIGSSKISLNSAQHKSDSSQIYLKTLQRGHNVNHMSTGMGTKSTMVIRKTPSGSNSSSKTKKIKVTSTNNPVTTSTKKKTTNAGGSSNKGAHGTGQGNVAQNPYPAGASHGHTIFSVTMPRQSFQQTINHGVHQANSNRLNNHH